MPGVYSTKVTAKICSLTNPDEPVEEAYMSYVGCILDEPLLIGPENSDEEPIDNEANPYEVAELTADDILYRARVSIRRYPRQCPPETLHDLGTVQLVGIAL